MKFVLSTDEFVPKLQQLTKVVASKTTMPILDCIKMEVKKEKQYMIATVSDTDTMMQMVAPCDADEDINLCIDAKMLLSTLSNLMGKTIEFDVNVDEHVVNGKYPKGKFKLPYFDTDDFPTISVISGDKEGECSLVIDSTILGNAIAATKPFVADDYLRPQMCGVHIDFNNDAMVSVATDGHRLVRYTDTNVKSENVSQLTIPEKPSSILQAMLAKFGGDVKMLFSESQVVVKCQYYNIVATLAQGKYPNYNAVIPKDNNNIVTVNKDALVEAIKHTAPLGNTKEEIMSFEVTGNTIKVKTEDIDFSTGGEEEIECKHDGDDIRIGFKSSMLMQMVQGVGSDNVVIKLSEPNRAGVFMYDGEVGDGIEYLSLLMPLVLNH